MSPAAQETIRKAVHHHPVTSVRGISERMFSYWFDGFVYNQIWEDPDVDMEAMELDDQSRILTIASAGCNILNYLSASPQAVCVVDLNKYHLYLTRLKIAAMRHLPTNDEFFDFFGHANKKINVDNYFKFIAPHLDEETRSYWESRSGLKKQRIDMFAKNLYNYGAMGFFIRFVHRLSKLFADDPQKMLQCKDQQELEALFEKKYARFFNRSIVKFIGRQPVTFYSLGIPPQQFDDMVEESNGKLNELCHNRVRRMALDFDINENYFAWQAFGRRYDTENRKAVPPYLKQENYETIKNNLDRIELNHCSTTDYLKKQPDNSMNRFVFLDSMDWMDAEDITELWTEVNRAGQPGSRVIFRTASWRSPIEDSLPEDLMKKFIYQKEKSLELHKKDRSSIYGGFHLYIKPE